MTKRFPQDDHEGRQQLFRPQVIKSLGCQAYGSVLLTQPFSHRALSVFFFGCALVIVIFFLVFETSRKTQTLGMVVPSTGLIKIASLESGTIVDIRAEEGQYVDAAQVLFVISTDRSSANTNFAQLKISDLLRQRRDSLGKEIDQSKAQAMQRIDVLRTRAHFLEEDIARVNGQLELQKTRISLVEQALSRFAELHAANYISAAQLQDKKQELLDQQQRLGDLQRAQTSAHRELFGARAELQEVSVQSEREISTLRRSMAAIEQDLTESEARREILVRASKKGTIGTITAELGQSVGGGAVLASLIPADANLEVELYAPSRAIGFVKPGLPVLLRYQAYPYQKFGQYAATVSEVAHTAMSPSELSAPLSETQSPEPLYRIRVQLEKQSVMAYGKSIPLRAGMLVNASIVTDRRKLYEWVLEPLSSISGQL